MQNTNDLPWKRSELLVALFPVALEYFRSNGTTIMDAVWMGKVSPWVYGCLLAYILQRGCVKVIREWKR